MRKYSKVYAVVWQDKVIRNLQDKTRTIFLYLLTSPHTNMIGWYYLNINYASADLAYPIDRVRKGLLELQEKGLITYSEDTNMVVIHNFLKYNPVKGSKQAKGAINTIENLADKSLLDVFAGCVAKHKRENEKLYDLLLTEYKDRISEEEIYPLDRVLKRHRKGINTDTNTDTNTNTDTDKNTSCSDSSESNEVKEYKTKFDKDSMPYRAAKHLRLLILENNSRQPVPDENPKDLEKWALELDRLNRLGPVGAKEHENKGYSWKEIGEIMEWCQQDNFWKDNILSAGKFREKITQLENKMNKSSHKSNEKMNQLQEIYQEYEEEEGSVEVL